MKLYIIGNGFDIHHDLRTGYHHFGLYLKQNYYEIYDLLLEYYGFEDLNTNNLMKSKLLWSSFEENMANLDTKSILSDNTDLMPNYSSDSFRARDYHAFEIEMDHILGLLTEKLYHAFKNFILEVTFPPKEQQNLFALDKNAIYITFNYTDTLTKYYDIKEDNILFLHGKAYNSPKNLILGHGINPDNFKDKPVVPPQDLNDEEYQLWYEEQANQYDYSFESAKHKINEYFSRTFKGTQKIIEEYEDFFSTLVNVDEVYIIGHSLSDVDMPYFQKLATVIPQQVKWTATFYSPDDESSHLNTLKNLRNSNIEVIPTISLCL